LLDDRSQTYRLAQAYGLDRSADSEEDRAGYGDFPLLDALRQQYRKLSLTPLELSVEEEVD